MEALGPLASTTVSTACTVIPATEPRPLRAAAIAHSTQVTHAALVLRHIRAIFQGPITMSLSLSIGPLVSLIAGILILVMPRLLSTIVALYLIIMGILGLLGMHTLRF